MYFYEYKVKSDVWTQVDMESDPVSEFIVHCKATHGLHSFA